jgi:hypothetical protein
MFWIRKISVLVDETLREAGQEDGAPLKRMVVMAAVHNPFAGEFKEDLGPIMEFGQELGVMFSERILAEFGNDPAQIESYGKGAIVGMAGELEHGCAILTRPLGKSLVFRDTLNGTSFMSETVKRGPIGTTVDISLAHKKAVFVRSHFDTIEVTMPDAPLDDEVVVVFAVANRGRLHARIGGLQVEDVVDGDTYQDKQ